MIDRVKIGAKLRNLRRTKQKTLEEASMEVGVTTSALAMYERGERVPRDEIKIKIAHYYDESVGNIFFS